MAVTFTGGTDEFVDPAPPSADEFVVEIGSMKIVFAADDADEEEFVRRDEFVDIESADDDDEDDEFVASEEDDEFVAATRSISDSLATAAGPRREDAERKELRRGPAKASPAIGTAVSGGPPHETQPRTLATASVTNPNSDFFMRTSVAWSSPL